MLFSDVSSLRLEHIRLSSRRFFNRYAIFNLIGALGDLLPLFFHLVIWTLILSFLIGFASDIVIVFSPAMLPFFPNINSSISYFSSHFVSLICVYMYSIPTYSQEFIDLSLKLDDHNLKVAHTTRAAFEYDHVIEPALRASQKSVFEFPNSNPDPDPPPCFVCPTIQAKTPSAYYAEILSLNSNLHTLKYLGKTISSGSSDPISMPTDQLATELLQTFSPDGLLLSQRTYRRVNPTAVRKVKYLKKFDKPCIKLSEKTMKSFSYDLHDFFKDIGMYEPSFQTQLLASLNDPCNYDDVKYNPSSASGYPLDARYPLRRDAITAAKQLAATQFLEGLEKFPTYWKTGGRGKLVTPDKISSSPARMVEYDGFQRFLIAGKYSQLFTSQMVKNLSKSSSAIGHSWFHNGASRFRNEILTALGYDLSSFTKSDPSDLALISLDVSGWDTSVPRELLQSLRDEHLNVISSLSWDNIPLKELWLKNFKKIYDDMIDAIVVLPHGYSYQTDHGMKSGWNLTAPDNTSAHGPIARAIQRNILKDVNNYIKVYGDDNLIALRIPTNRLADSDAYIRELIQKFSCLYGHYNFKINPKTVSYGRSFSEVDFLSKTIIDHPTIEGAKVPYRPTVETFSRIIYPEVFQSRKVSNVPLHTAERMLGHLIDNFYNLEVRNALLQSLTVLRDVHKVKEVPISADFCRKFGLKDLPFTTLPTVPSVSQIESLYGFDVSSPPLSPQAETCTSAKTWNELNDAYLKPPRFQFFKTDDNRDYALSVDDYINRNSHERDLKVSPSRIYAFKKLLTPFTVYSPFKGNAGAKLGQSIKTLTKSAHLNRFTITSSLDIGSHPGSAINAQLIWFPNTKIQSISLHPQIDEEKAHCYKVSDRSRVNFAVEDALTSQAYPQQAQFVNIDTAIGPDMGFNQPRTEITHIQTRLSLRVLRQCVNKYPLSYFVCKITNLSDQYLRELYNYYLQSSFFDFIKPYGSYPWNNEILVIFKSEVSHRKNPFRYNQFLRSFYNYHNALSKVKMLWASFRIRHLARNSRYDRNPLQTNEAIQKRITSKCIPHSHNSLQSYLVEEPFSEDDIAVMQFISSVSKDIFDITPSSGLVTCFLSTSHFIHVNSKRWFNPVNFAHNLRVHGNELNVSLDMRPISSSVHDATAIINHSSISSDDVYDTIADASKLSPSRLIAFGADLPIEDYLAAVSDVWQIDPMVSTKVEYFGRITAIEFTFT